MAGVTEGAVVSGAEIYVVKQGDTIDSIADAFLVDVGQIIEDNQLIYPFELAVGQALFIDLGTRNPVGNVRTIGYAYPFISRWVLEQTVPYLSELAIFSYGFTPDGYLLSPQLPVDWMIAVADEYGTQSVLTLTPFGLDGKFNNQLIHAMVNDETAVNRLIDELLYTMENKGYSGVDIDFEYILAEDRDAFTEFVRRVAERMRANGYYTSVALAPKTSAEQKGLLYEGKDYRALGEAADHVLLMTYEWGYTYGPPMAVAPINQVRRVVEYEQGVPIEFDNLAASPFFRYQAEGIEHEVWFEDVRSLQQKFDLMKEFGLGGCGYWQIMRWFKANWLLLEKNFYVNK